MNYIQQILAFLSLHGGLAGCLILALLLLLSILKIRKLKNHLKADRDSHWRELSDCRNALDDSHELHSALNSKIYGLQRCIAQLEEDNQTLSKENKSLRKKLNAASDALEKQKDKQLYAASSKEKLQKIHKEVDSLFEHSTSSLIQLRGPAFMNTQESRKLYHVSEELASPEYKEKYGGDLYVFPQVALHSIFSRTETAEEYDTQSGDNYTLRIFLSKSVDFLICVKKYIKEDNYSEYMHIPILAIEIDGPHHEQAEQKEKDHQKDLLFQAVNLPLLRFSLEENKNDKTAIRQKVREILLPKGKLS